MVARSTIDSEETLAAHDPIDYQRTHASVRHRLFGGRTAPQTKLGRFVVTGSAGAGQMGRVYVARDTDLDRPVAIKVIARERDPHRNARLKQRLMREGQAIAKLSHPNVISIHEVGQHDGELFIVMEYVEGQTLRRWLREPRRWQQVVRTMAEAGRGLAAAHHAGLVHRDFKPDNVMIRHDGRVVVLDFGLALTPDELAPKTTDTEAEVPTFEPLTVVDGLAGTPAYMAPELFDGARADPLSDQFAFCVCLYEALYGRRPFDATTAVGLLAQVVDGPALGGSGAAIPPWLGEVIAQGLRPEPNDRHRTMRDLVAELVKRRITRRTQALIGLASLGLVAGGATLSMALDPGPSCDGGKARLATVWDAERRAELERNMVTALPPEDHELAAVIGAKLDGYVATWSAAHTEACERTHVHHDQSPQLMDRRMACLGQRLVRFDALVDVFSGGDPQVLGEAVAAVEGLPPVGPCSDLDHVRSTVPDPGDPQLRGEVDAARARLARAQALIAAGRYADGLAAAELATADAQTIDYLPLRAESLATVGNAQRMTAQLEAERTLLDAVAAAEAGAHDRATAEIWIHIVHAARDDARAGGHLERARAAVARLGDPLDLRQQLVAANGNFALRTGDNPKARELFTQARELASQRGDAAASARAEYLLSMTSAAFNMADYEAAAQHAAQAETELRRVHGSSHPSLSRAVNNRGVALLMGGRFRDAIVVFERAAEIARATVGPDHPNLASPLHNIGASYHQLGEFDRAIEMYRKGLAIEEKAWGPDDARLGRSLSNIARALTEVGQIDEAVQTAERSVLLFERAKGPDHPSVAKAVAGLGTIYVEAQRTEEGIAALRRALAIERERLGPDNVETAQTQGLLADALRAGGRLAEAQVVGERALATLRAELGDHADVGRTLTTLGRIRLDRGRRSEAAAAFAEALRIYDVAEATPEDRTRAQDGLDRSKAP